MIEIPFLAALAWYAAVFIVAVLGGIVVGINALFRR